jgi:hypothetical protein
MKYLQHILAVLLLAAVAGCSAGNFERRTPDGDVFKGSAIGILRDAKLAEGEYARNADGSVKVSVKGAESSHAAGAEAVKEGFKALQQMRP